MTLVKCCKNKRGVALMYAIMVLFLLATVIVAITALASTSYSEAVLTASDDQSYLYAKSIGLAIKEQFKDGYNVSSVINTLDQKIAADIDPVVTGRYYVENNTGEEMVEGTVSITYAKDSATGDLNTEVLEVRVACIYNNSLSIVTSVFSCEADSADVISKVKNAFDYYDVILTNKDEVSFDFADTNGAVRVYVYAGEDDTVVCPPFYLSVDMNGALTTTGACNINGGAKGLPSKKKIKGDVTSYGYIGFINVEVTGSKGVHSDGSVALGQGAFITNSIFSRGDITLNSPGTSLNANGWIHNNGLSAVGKVQWPNNDAYKVTSPKAQAKNLVALGNVLMEPLSYISGSIFARGNVTLNGSQNLHYFNTWVDGSVYSNGNVTIGAGAVVYGNVIAQGNVTISGGAMVYGNVQSKGNVQILGGVIGGKVDCLGELKIQSYRGSTQYGWWLYETFGTDIYSGIGLFRGLDSNHSADKIVHSCGSLALGTSDYYVTIYGDIYVEKGTSNSDYTVFQCVKITDTVYLRNSRALFGKVGDQTTSYPGAIVINYIRQKQDFYYTTSDKYVKMNGATVGIIEAGDGASSRDIFITDGKISVGLIGRCGDIKAVYFYNNVNLIFKQYLKIAGTGKASTVCPDGFVNVPYGSNIWVDAETSTYTGDTPNSSYGLNIGNYVACHAGTTIHVGSAASIEYDGGSKAVVTLGTNSNPAQTHIASTVHAVVKNFTINGATHLPGATIHAMTSGTFTVNNTSAFGVDRTGSRVNLWGNINLQGELYDLYHYSGKFTNGTNGKILGKYWSQSNDSIDIKGVFGSIESYGNATVTLTAALTVTDAMCVNGTFNNTGTYKLSVGGDLYVAKLSTGTLNNVTVGGNAEIAQPKSPFTITSNTKVTGTLITPGADVTLSAGEVGGVSGKSLTVNNGAKIGGTGAVTYITYGITVNGGEFNTCSARCQTFTQTGGTLKKVKLYVSGSGTPINISGTAAGSDNNFYAPNGAFSVTGGTSINYTGKNTIQAKYTSKVEGRFRSGITITNGDLTIGNDSDTSYYDVGAGATTIYASKTVTWRGMARSPYDSTPGSGSFIVAAGGNVTIGSASKPIKGVFHKITSSSGNVVAYVEKVDAGIYASKAVTAKISGYLCKSSQLGVDKTQYGIYAGTTMDLSASSAGVKYYGTLEAGGKVTISSSLSMCARIKCSDIEGVNNITQETSSSLGQQAIFVSLRITGASSTPFFLERSIAKDSTGTTGSITLENRPFKLASGKHVEGYIYVNGIYTYGDSTVNLDSVGGVYCLNTEVNAVNLKGAVDLPNVTTITIGSDISSLRADKVTSLTLSRNFSGSLSLSNLTALTVNSGITVGGALEVTKATLTNNGTINGGAKCKKYTGSGVVKGKLIITGSDKSTITGNVEADVYASCPLEIKNATSVGSTDSYIYSTKAITCTSVTFNSNMDYIMSSGGAMTFTNCKQMPNIRAVSGAGEIMFKNDSEANRGTIKSVWSKATSIRFGDSTSNNYQTVTGILQWQGTVSTDSWGVKIRSQNTKIQGVTKLIGTGKVQINGNFSTDVFLHNSYHAEFKGGYIAKCLYLNVYNLNNNNVRLTSFDTDSNATVNQDAYIYGNASTSISLNCKINRTLRADNVHLNVYGTVGGQLIHTASIFGYVVQLGTTSKRAVIGGDIAVRGYLLDNSENTGKITVLGYYYGDTNKKYSGCTAIRLSQDGGVGWTWIFSSISGDYLNGNIDVEGWLFIYSTHTSSNSFAVKGNIYCNNLTVNTYNYASGAFPGTDSVSPARKRGNTSMLTCIQTGLLPTQNTDGSYPSGDSNTKKDSIVFQEVHCSQGSGYVGSAYCVNSKFNHLRTDGQVCLTSCYFMSRNFNDSTYSSTGQHCSYSSNDNGINVSNDGSMFVHNKETKGTLGLESEPWNLFNNVTTKSNVSIYKGWTILNGGTCFEGAVKNDLGKGVNGSVATTLFYFGDSVFIWNGSYINAAKNGSLSEFSAPAARTIVWIANGDLQLAAGCRIGHQKSDLGRTRLTLNPGLFISNGSAYVSGDITLDTMVKYDLVIYSGGEVLGKDSGGTSYRAGMFLVGRNLSEVNNNFRIKHSDKPGGSSSANCERAYETNWGGDCYTPDASGYASYMTKKFVKISGTTTANLKQCYKPRSSTWAPGSVDGATLTCSLDKFTPAGRASDKLNGLPLNDYYSSAINSYSAPSMPTLSVSGGFGVASVEPLQFVSSLGPASSQNYTVSTVGNPSVNAATSEAVPSLELMANWADLVTFSFEEEWANHPAKVNYATMFSKWDTEMFSSYTIEQHLDKTNVKNNGVGKPELWGPRVIPMTWQLPNKYTTSSGSTVETQANRVLVGKQFSGGDIELSSTGSSVAKDKNYVTEDIYTNYSNNLKTYNVNNVFNDRKNTSGTAYNGTKKLLDYIKRYHTSSDDNPRLADLLIFESGELPYKAFYRDDNSGDDYTLWSRIGRPKVIANEQHKTHWGTDRNWDFFFWKYFMQKRYDSDSGWYSKYYLNGKMGDWEDEFAVTYPKQAQIPYYQYHGNSEKKIAGQYQDSWFWSSEAVGNYNANWIFYACANPSDPYGSAAKDLHVVLPKGIGVEFMRDIDNKIIVLGRGRVFLYLTSGDTLYFRGDLKSDEQPTTWYVGGLTNRKKDGSYLVSSDHNVRRPQLYIIGAGTNIDLIIREMQLMAFVYMPFGTSNSLYNSSDGNLKNYNIFNDITGNHKANSNEGSSKVSTAVTDVKRNALTLVWDNAKNKRYLYGSIVTDNFYFTAGSDKKLQFAEYPARYGPDFSDTKIYGPSTYSGSTTKLSTTYHEISLTEMMSQPPGYSTTMLNWNYVGMKVVN